MNFTITTLARSLAEYLAPFLPGVQMLEDPAQQGVEPPCMFIQQRGSDIKPYPRRALAAHHPARPDLSAGL